MLRKTIIPAAAALLAGPAGAASADSTFVLYRSAVGLPDTRIHVATFDNTSDNSHFDASFNLENGQIAASLFRNQPGVSVVYWCEPGGEGR